MLWVGVSRTAADVIHDSRHVGREPGRRSLQRSWKTSYLASGAKGKLEREGALLDDGGGRASVEKPKYSLIIETLRILEWS